MAAAAAVLLDHVVVGGGGAGRGSGGGQAAGGAHGSLGVSETVQGLLPAAGESEVEEMCEKENGGRVGRRRRR